MSKGYDLIYDRLWAHEKTRFLVDAMEAALRTFRASEYRFKLSLAHDAPPELNTEWRIVSTAGPTGGRVLDAWTDFRYGDAPDIWAIVTDKVVNHQAMRDVARVLYPDDREHSWQSLPPVREGQIPRTFPCLKHVVVEGRRHGDKGGSKDSFSTWAMDRIRAKHQENMELRRKKVVHRTNAIAESLPFKMEHDRTLEELAVEELAQRMVHFSKIPNVIERASKLFVVKDVMEG